MYIFTNSTQLSFILLSLLPPPSTLLPHPPPHPPPFYYPTYPTLLSCSTILHFIFSILRFFSHNHFFTYINYFIVTCKAAGVDCTGGQTVVNPWPIIGGTAMSACARDEFIMPTAAVAGIK